VLQLLLVDAKVVDEVGVHSAGDDVSMCDLNTETALVLEYVRAQEKLALV
jgi:hypothetical protein